MATYRITAPDGASYKITAPDDATQEQVMAYAQANYAQSGRTKNQSAPTSQAQLQDSAYNPTDDMGVGQRMLAGFGMGMNDLWVGTKQRLGLASQDEVDEKRRTDAALRNTTSGTVGSILGKVVTTAPTFWVPGVGTLVGAAATGGGLGVLEPTAQGESVAKNAALGAAGGVAGAVAVRALGSLYQGGKALLEPFYQSGREKVVGRVLRRFAEQPGAIANANSRATATGAIPTLAESTGDRGIASLQRALESIDPQLSGRFTQRAAENNAARVGVLQNIAGDEARRAAIDASIKAQTGPLYSAATSKTVPVDAAFNELLARPSMKSALGRAGNIAQEQGRTLGLTQPTVSPASMLLDAAGKPITASVVKPGTITGQALQDLKMAMDDMLRDPTAGIAGKEVAAVKATRAQLVDWMERQIPEFRTAREATLAGKKQLNQMDVGQRLLDKTTAAVRDLGGNQKLQANAYARALNDEMGLVRNATGFRGVNSLDQVMTPAQMASLNAVRKELEPSANLAQAANGAGSQTAKSLASQNMMRQMIGPTGLPQSWAESALMRTVLRPVQFGMQAAEPMVLDDLAKALLSPTFAQQTLARVTPQAPRGLLSAGGSKALKHGAAATNRTAIEGLLSLKD